MCICIPICKRDDKHYSIVVKIKYNNLHKASSSLSDLYKVLSIFAIVNTIILIIVI